ncbi:hypothetical protein HPB50_018862 [Hyalomma asiaticum]|uniref:Uncharacterized protein n=1 Tax=Hyalomma asiaticum TaxID=266040 RepID=A0ACB7S3T4_HYAAI|nr:hypothetical protein HPB50_018862 [Hyalomma asiaticum]
MSRRDDNVLLACVRRVRRDIADIVRDPPPGIYIAPDENDITRIDALVVGPPGTPYQGGFLLFHLAFPPEYPIRPPEVRFLNADAGQAQLHPLFLQDGRVSVSILDTCRGLDEWSSAQSLCSLLVSIQSLLAEDPYYEQEMFHGMYRNKETYREKANKYKAYVHHEVFRVTVCDAVENCLQERSVYPPVLRETVLKLFLECYERYEESVSSRLHLNATAMPDPDNLIFGTEGTHRGTYRYEELLERLRDLKAKVEKRGQPMETDA